LASIASSLTAWILASLLLLPIAALFYACVANNHVVGHDPKAQCPGFVWIWHESFSQSLLDIMDLPLSVMLSSITLQPMTTVDDIVKNCGNWGTVAAITHLGFAYTLFGIFISMLYRKVTRG
jgi:hypothetical protein